MTNKTSFPVAFAFMTMALAGCLGGGADGSDASGPENVDPSLPADLANTGIALAVLWCPMIEGAPVCNQEMTPDPERQGNELTIAVDPTNPLNIVGGAKDYYPLDAGECVWDGVYVTHDGGLTYEDRSFDGSPWRLRQDPDNYSENYASTFWCTTDPVAYFDTAGTFYYLLMAYQTDPATGSKTCEHECPNGAFNDWAFNRATQIVAVSDDAGDTFHTFTPVMEGTYPVNFHDKGWIAASGDGTIHVMWLGIPTPGNMYFRSTDGGQTFTDPEVLSTTGSGSGQGSFVDVGTGDEVYATWVASGGMQLKRSFDKGDTWDDQRTVLNKFSAGMPGLSDRDRRGGFPAMATDRWPESPYGDAIYYVWQDACQDPGWHANCTRGNASVYFAASYDKGDTFTTPIRLNDDRYENGTPNADNYQIFPAVSVSPGGVIDVTWMDTRDTRELYYDGEAQYEGTYRTFEQYYTYSLDGGQTWSPNFFVRDHQDNGWDPTYSHHQNGMIFIGDYNDIDSSWGAAHPVWPDTRSETWVDVYTAVIQRPLFADAWSESDKDALRASLVEDGLVSADHPFLNLD